ncbi:peptide ABC transporter substrate-binding protein [Paenibacillus wynnii]|uniref:peptide ABC transporter substrate-binding protein n=1 Tax=Paenibacillus wynnii TaxID=268407 RepID=UPI00278E0B3C|nr:peptide ABC transporter substrate-binding protein [Paenibacillus wynnii]MDQ0192592.1 oligopeptide transport system substrate-binding protein [Paenibacillus wynnii]
MKKSKSLLLIIALVLVIGTVLAGCGNNTNSANNGNNGNTANTGNTAGDEKLAADQTLRLNMTADVPTFDPGQAQDSQAHVALKLMYEGLVRVDKDGKEAPGVAEKWEVSADGLVYTFHLRDSQWSNGDPVTANDFVFAWKRVLDPATVPAPPYAQQLYYLKNAEQFNKGEIKDFSEVGVKAQDDHTLVVTLKNPTAYFLNLMDFYTFYPVHKSVEGNDKWATDTKTMITNGPFNLTSWITGQSLEYTKNDTYWDKDNIKLTKITSTIVNEASTEVLSYKNGEIDRAGAPNGDIPPDQVPVLKTELPDDFTLKPVASIYYYEFNTLVEPFDNANIRKAFAMSISRQDIVDKVTLASQTPAFGYIPPGIKGSTDAGDYRSEYKDDYFTEDYAEAKKLLELGMKEKGYTTLPPVTLIYNTSEGHKKIALAIADMWKNNLGVEVKTENQEWGVFIENRQNGDYQVARAGWNPDYNDPMTFMDMWKKGNGNNDIKLDNPEYDKLLDEAFSEVDNAKRMANFRKAEEILVKDQMGIMPIYYYTNVSLVKPYLKGVSVGYDGAVDYSKVYLLEH